MTIGDYKDNTINAFSAAYKYLISMYASDAGKSDGEYYTHQAVSESLTSITLVGKTEVNRVYDIIMQSFQQINYFLDSLPLAW